MISGDVDDPSVFRSPDLANRFPSSDDFSDNPHFFFTAHLPNLFTQPTVQKRRRAHHRDDIIRSRRVLASDRGLLNAISPFWNRADFVVWPTSPEVAVPMGSFPLYRWNLFLTDASPSNLRLCDSPSRTLRLSPAALLLESSAWHYFLA